MPDGDMRRPPLLWEQRLAKRVSALGPGVVTSSGANVVEDFGASTGYNEPDDTITTLGTPSTPTVTGTLKGVAVGWDGNDTDGDPYNAENQWVEVHVGGTAGFTPGTATKRGVLYESGSWVVTPLTAGSTYYAQLVGYDSEGNASEPSAEASGSPGLVISSDIGTGAVGTAAVSFSARDVGGITQTVSASQPASAILNDTWINTTDGSYNVYNGSSWVTQSWGSASISAGAINTLQLAAGAVTANTIAGSAIIAGKIAAGAVDTDQLAAGAVTTNKLTAGTITGFFITGGTVQSSSGTSRVVLNSTDNSIDFFFGGIKTAELAGATIAGNNGLTLTGTLDVDGKLYTSDDLIVGSGKKLLPESSSDLVLMAGSATTSGYFTCQNVYDYTSGSGANVVVGAAGKLLRSTSRASEKYRIVPYGSDLSEVPVDKISTPEADGAVDLYDVLDLAPSQFARLEDQYREVDPETGDVITPAPEYTYLGFIAEDVAAKFPIASEWDEEGAPSSYDTRAIVSALLGVVRDQQATITDLTARIEALEG